MKQQIKMCQDKFLPKPIKRKHKPFNKSLEKNVFPQNLKLVDVPQKKNDPLEKNKLSTCYCALRSIENFDRTMRKQINSFIIE